MSPMVLRFGLLCLSSLAAHTLTWAQSASQEVPVTYRPENVILNLRPPPEAPSPEAAVSYAKRGTVPVPGPEVLDLQRPREDYPALLSPTDFHGRVRKPSTQFFDPFNSSMMADGQPTAPGDKPMLEERATYIQMQPWGNPTISVAEEAWVTLILLREGELVYPRSQLVGSDSILEVTRSLVKESPYIYLRARPNRTDRSGNYLRTTLDIETVDKEQRVFVYKFHVQVVPMFHPSHVPTVKVDMRDAKLPPIYGREGSRYADDAAGGAILNRARTGLGAASSASRVADVNEYRAGSVLFSDGRRFSREDTRKLLPLMIGMAKAYDEAVQAGAKGYEAQHIVPFQPNTVLVGRDGRPQPTSGKIPAFNNPYDGQIYFVVRSYFFPRYDAILYDVSFRNRSTETLWWDYSQLGLIPGAESSEHPETPTVVSPELGETTPPGELNTLWVLVQGRGWKPSTPIRLAFPPRGMESRTPRLIQPHIETPKASTEPDVSLLRREAIDFFPPR